MKTKTILVMVVMILTSLHPANLIAESVVKSPCYYQETNKGCVERLVKFYAKKYRVNAQSMMRTLTNENPSFDFDLQSNCVYKKGNRWKLPAGSKERSYGLAQIHLPDWKEITYAQATNPDFAINFMAKKFSEGKQTMWMGYRG